MELLRMVREFVLYLTCPAGVADAHAVTSSAPWPRAEALSHDHTYSIRSEPYRLSAYRRRENRAL